MQDQKTTLEYVKRLAKKIKKEQNITHVRALETASQMQGFSCYQECHQILKPKPC